MGSTSSTEELPDARGHCMGEVRVNRQIVGFKKVKFYTMENIRAGNLSTPEQEMHTTSFWLHFILAHFPISLRRRSRTRGTRCGRWRRCRRGLCDPRDLGVTLTEDSTEPSRDCRPNLYLYDNYPGGIGGSQPLFKMQERLLRSAAELIAGCPRTWLPELCWSAEKGKWRSGATGALTGKTDAETGRVNFRIRDKTSFLFDTPLKMSIPNQKPAKRCLEIVLELFYASCGVLPVMATMRK